MGKSVGCTLKLLSEKDDRNTPRNRLVEISLTNGATKNSGTWSLMADSRHPELNIGTSSGRWVLNQVGDAESPTLYVIRSDREILLELYDLDSNFIERVGCADSFSGNAWRQGPPASDLAYSIWFGCS
jgi:hypothetical protein